jgi:phage tail protein X
LSVNDIYVISTAGDRFDLLASQYYGDSSLWWVISIANENLSQNSLYIPEGTQLRIPSNPTTVVSSYNQLNS